MRNFKKSKEIMFFLIISLLKKIFLAKLLAESHIVSVKNLKVCGQKTKVRLSERFNRWFSNSQSYSGQCLWHTSLSALCSGVCGICKGYSGLCVLHTSAVYMCF